MMRNASRALTGPVLLLALGATCAPPAPVQADEHEAADPTTGDELANTSGEPKFVIVVPGPRVIAFASSDDMNTALACDLLRSGGGTGPFNPEGVPDEVLDTTFPALDWPDACDAVGVFENDPPFFGGGSGGGDGGDGSDGGDFGSGGNGSTPPSPYWTRDRFIQKCEARYDPVNVEPGSTLEACVVEANQLACESLTGCFPPDTTDFDPRGMDLACAAPILENLIEVEHPECFGDVVTDAIQQLLAPPYE